jgi:hypothetical protein
VSSQLSAALRAAAAGLHPDEAGTGLIISHGVFLHRGDFTRFTFLLGERLTWRVRPVLPAVSASAGSPSRGSG